MRKSSYHLSNYISIFKYRSNYPYRFIKSSEKTSGMMIYIEKWLIDKLNEYQKDGEISDLKIEDLCIFDIKNEDELKTIKYLVTLGGDGTILYAAK